MLRSVSRDTVIICSEKGLSKGLNILFLIHQFKGAMVVGGSNPGPYVGELVVAY